MRMPPPAEKDALHDTARRIAALEASELQYRTVVENAVEAVVVVQDGKVTFGNEVLYQVSGYSQEELDGFSFAEFVHPEDRGLVFERYLRRLSGEAVEPSYAFRAVTKQGEILWLQTNSVLITWEGRPATLSYLRDITQHKAMEAKLGEALKMEAIATLSRGIAHDFNNILSAILGYAQLAKVEVADNARARMCLEQVLKASRRARELVRRITTFTERSGEPQRPVDLTEIVLEAVELIRASLPSTIGVERRITPESIVVMADPTELHQVVMNLCTNAHQAMERSGGVLTVELEALDLAPQPAQALTLAAGPYVRLGVHDTGQGLDSDTLPRIFDPYFTTKSAGRGTGMGLAVVHGIVKHHRGAVRVQSSPHSGTRFDVYLPRAEDAVMPPPEPPRDRIYQGREHILLVDDEAALADLGKLLLERFGYTVTSLTDPQEALCLFTEAPSVFDVVVTDLTMPGLTGNRLAQALLAIRPEVPIILYTGFAEKITREETAAQGIRGLLFKPLDLPELTRTIRLALGEKV